MAMDFGKNNRSVAFNPTSAFPLDARSYFESYDAAVAAAAIAEEAGSSNSVYYFGQTLAVVENEKATLYIIQPNKTITPIGETAEVSSVEIDNNQFQFDANGNLSLLNYSSAEAGQMLILDENKKLKWVTPIDTYTKNEIDSKIAAAGHLKRKPVKNFEEIEKYIDENTDFNEYIFMVPNGLIEEANKYDEYIVIEEFDSDNILIGNHIEKVGSWEVDLTEYAKKDDLKDYIIDPKDESKLMTKAEAEKLNALNEKAEENVINEVSSDFTIDENRKLNLNNLSQEKIIGLSESLANKFDRSEGQLISATDKAKLDALQLNGEDLEVSGTINATQVSNLKEWIEDNASDTKGLSENNLSNSLYESIVSAITKVESGNLNIQNINMDQVNGLEEALAAKAKASDITNITQALNSLTPAVQKNTADIESLQQQLIWHQVAD